MAFRQPSARRLTPAFALPVLSLRELGASAKSVAGQEIPRSALTPNSAPVENR